MISFPTTPVVVTSEMERVAALRVAQLDRGAGVGESDLSFQQWIVAFEHYIETRTENGTTTYHFDERRAPEGEHAVAAKVSCAIHNALPLAMRSSSEDFTPVQYDAVEDVTGCQDEARWNTYFWGGSLYLNHCLIQDINGYAGNASKIGALLTSVLAAIGSGPPGWVLLAATTFLAVNAAWLQAADTHCGGAGAFLQIPWISPGTPFVKQNC